MFDTWLVSRRLPWIRAVEPRDCGASVFASIAAYYGHHLSLEQARQLVGTDRNGTALSGLRDGGRAIGLDARPAQATYDALQHVHLPAIAHLNEGDGHYLVLYRWTPKHVIVLDPNYGVRRLERGEFERQWSGYVVEYRPTPALQPRAADVRPWRTVLHFLQQHKQPMVLALMFALLATSLGWASSFFLRTLIDHILPNRETGLLMALGIALLLISMVQALLQFGRLWLVAWAGRRIHQSYAQRYVQHMFRLPMHVFDSRCVPRLVLRIAQSDMIQQSITEGMVGLASDAVLFVAALGVMFLFDPMAALIAVAAVPVIAGILLLLNGRVYTTQLLALGRNDDFHAYLMDTFDGVRTIKTFGAEQRYEALLLEKLQNVTTARYHSRLALALPTTWSVLATASVTSGILWYGSMRVLAGEITIGDLVVLFGMLAFYLNPVQRLPTALLNVRTAIIAMDRIEEILALPGENTRVDQPVALPPVHGRIEFAQVNFAYKPRRPVLKGINLVIEPGETVAIVGETGSGKTSLANLIAGFYLPTEGDVRIDGISTRMLTPDAFRQAVSAVFQDSRLFQHSLRDNITMLNHAPHEAVRQAATMANAASFIDASLRGYNTHVARGGSNFSSGQAQRIALARALLKDAPILLLDEATSNLDGATEQGVLQALEHNRRNRTTVIIAHRLSTVLRADRVFVMHNGEIVEAGTHNELINKRGRYYNLFQWQVINEDVPHAARMAG